MRVRVDALVPTMGFHSGTHRFVRLLGAVQRVCRQQASLPIAVARVTKIRFKETKTRVSKHAGDDRDRMVCIQGREPLQIAAAGASHRIFVGVGDMPDAADQQGPQAHQAGFEC